MKQVKMITIAELAKLAQATYGDMLKGVIDISNSAVILDMEMHVDGEQYLLERGSKQSDLWGFNLYPKKYGTKDFIEFDSMINIRPRQDNYSRDVEDSKLRAKIAGIIAEAVKK